MELIEFPPVVPHWRLKGKFVYSFIMKFNFQYWESVQFFLSFRSRVANLVSVSILVFNCTELPFERCTVKWSQLSSTCHFPTGDSKFNSKGNVILLFVEIFKSKKNCSESWCWQCYNSKVNSFPCCSPIFIMTKMLPKVMIQKLMR